MIKKYVVTVFLIALFFVFTSNPFAHGVGVSVPKDDGNYTLEFEYSTPQVIEGETNSYVFRLLDKKTLESIIFDSVLVRFERKSDRATYAIARISQDELQDGVGRLTMMLNNGDYLVSVAFYKSDKKIAEANYDLPVGKTNEARKFPITQALYVISGMFLGFLTTKLTGNLASKK